LTRDNNDKGGAYLPNSFWPDCLEAQTAKPGVCPILGIWDV
jgi:hypothetical protein